MTAPVQWRASPREGFVDIPPGGTDAFTRLDSGDKSILLVDALENEGKKGPSWTCIGRTSTPTLQEEGGKRRWFLKTSERG